MQDHQRWPERVRLFEVGPRDGLQHEPSTLPVATRLEFIRRLAEAGLRDIEIGSFVHPRWVPQMADTDDLVARIPSLTGVRLWALVPNLTGFARAVAAGATNLCFLVSASETHSRKNLNRPIAEAIAEVERLAEAAARRGAPWRGYVSVAFGCPYEGAVDFGAVLTLARRMLDLGARQVSLGDTTGMGNPRQVGEAARQALDEFGPDKLALHFHDTRGLGMTNAYVALEEGVNSFDTSAGGIGGCPYAPGAAGNLSTEDLVQLLRSLGVECAVDFDKLISVARWLDAEAKVRVHSRSHRYACSQATAGAH